MKNDSPCGSTIGPILASGTGIKTVDVGCAMLGMHSIRETCGILDGTYYHDLFTEFYGSFEKINHDLFEHWKMIEKKYIVKEYKYYNEVKWGELIVN